MILQKQNTEHYKWGDNCDGWHLLKSNDLSVIEERMPPKTSELLHCHQKAKQFFYILNGEATFEINGEEVKVSSRESIIIEPKSIHKISNESNTDIEFLLVSQPMAQGDRIEIIDYNENLNEPIKTLNYEWLERYFSIEPNDVKSLSNPKEEIINKGGIIFYAQYNKEIVGTCSLLKINESTFELAKMAVANSAQGKGIGSVLMDYAFILASKMKLQSLVLFSNTKLASAIHLYKKYGFVEIDFEQGIYKRSNIKMERSF